MLTLIASISIASVSPSFCEIVSEADRYEGQAVTVRAAIRFGHPESLPRLIDTDCARGIGAVLHEVDGVEELYGRQVKFATFEGVIQIAPCTAFPSPGSTCGPYLKVEKVTEVQKTKSCWGVEMITSSTGRYVLRACPRASE